MNEATAAATQTAATIKSKTVTSLIEAAIILFAVLLGLGIRGGILGATVVISGSMEPTIAVGDHLLIDHRQSLHGTYARGDILVFEQPDTWYGEQSMLTKRLIALPGETVWELHGVIWVNGKPLKEPYLKETPIDQSGPPLTLKPNEYYVLGDNRNKSDDSRYNGPVPDANVWGRAIYRISPLSRVGPLPAVNY